MKAHLKTIGVVLLSVLVVIFIPYLTGEYLIPDYFRSDKDPSWAIGFASILVVSIIMFILALFYACVHQYFTKYE